mgnify:CR=1 FL=1
MRTGTRGAPGPGGAPKPGPAGTKETMTVEGLPAGKVDLAIKSWDAASNSSGLSNVVEVQTK